MIRLFSQWWIEKDVQGSGHGLKWSGILTEGRGKLQNPNLAQSVSESNSERETEMIEYEAQVIQIRQQRFVDLSYEGCMPYVLETWI
jgi:hypothetical protein